MIFLTASNGTGGVRVSLADGRSAGFLRGEPTELRGLTPPLRLLHPITRGIGSPVGAGQPSLCACFGRPRRRRSGRFLPNADPWGRHGHDRNGACAADGIEEAIVRSGSKTSHRVTLWLKRFLFPSRRSKGSGRATARYRIAR